MASSSPLVLESVQASGACAQLHELSLDPAALPNVKAISTQALAFINGSLAPLLPTHDLHPCPPCPPPTLGSPPSPIDSSSSQPEYTLAVRTSHKPHHVDALPPPPVQCASAAACALTTVNPAAPAPATAIPESSVGPAVPREDLVASASPSTEATIPACGSARASRV